MGLNVNRYQLAEPAIHTVVSSLSQNPIYAGALAANAFPKTFDEIKPRRALSPVSPTFDLSWNAAVLSQYKERLQIYVPLRDQFYNAINLGRFEDAAHALDSIEEQLGVSIWLMFSRLSLIQQSEGISAQKAYLEAVLKSEKINSFFAYLAFFFSYGLEENVSVMELNREVENLAAAGVASDLVAYFRYHASPLGLSAVNNPHDCITLEENSPIIDRFETFVAMSQLMTVRADDVSTLRELYDAAKLLGEISDIRIRNMLALIDQSTVFEQDDDFLAACEAYTVGDEDRAAELCRYALSQTAEAAWWYELASKLGQKPREENSLAARCIDSLRNLACLEDQDDLSSDLKKLAIFARKQPLALCIAAFLDRGADIIISSKFSENQALWALSSPTANPLHLPIIRRVSPAALTRLIEHAEGNAPNCTLIHTAALYPESFSSAAVNAAQLPEARRLHYLGHIWFRSGDYENALQFYRQFESIASSTDRYRALRSIYLCLRNLDRADEAVAHLTHWLISTPRTVGIFPLSEAAEWAIQTRAIDSHAIFRAVFLQICTENGHPSKEGDLSDAYEDALEHFGCDRPSQLLALAPSIDPVLFKTFLRSVCTISRMEDSINFDGLEDIEEDRFAILQWLLLEDDRQHHKSYTSEISAIVKDQEVARLANQFDRSRIYVDEAGVRKEIDHELREAVTRYKQLLSHPQLELKIEGIEQSLRRLIKKSDIEYQDLHLPSTERESVFRSLYELALNHFALSPAYGFQTYLSTRILHGSLEGELRSSFLSRNLLFNNGDEEIRAVWRQRLASLNDTEFDRVARVLGRFSDRVTKAVNKLKDHQIRARTRDWPEGQFTFETSDVEVARLRATLTMETQYEEFLARLFGHFWALVEDGLEKVKGLLAEHAAAVEAHVSAALHALSLLSEGGRVAEVSDGLAHGLTEFSADLDRVKSWFSRSGVLPPEPFTIDVAVGVAARITNKCHPNSPAKSVIEGGSLIVDGQHLNAFVDLLSNCLNNSVQHSGLGDREHIVSISATLVEQGVRVSITNDLSPSKDLVETQRLLAEKIGGSADDHVAMNEGGSGLRKIRRILQYDFQTADPLTIEVLPEFRVRVTVVVPAAQNLEGGNVELPSY